MAKLCIMPVELLVEIMDGLGGLVGGDGPLGVRHNCNLHPGLDVGLVETGEDLVAAVRLELGVYVLLPLNVEGHAAPPIFVVVVPVQNRHLVPAPLQVGNRDVDEILGSPGF